MEAIRNSFSFAGVSTRKSFWLTQLSLMVISFVASFVYASTMYAIYPHYIDLPVALDPVQQTGIFDIALGLVLFIPSVAVYKKRLNDAGWSGWWMLMPILNIVVAGFFKSKTEDNKYLAA